MTDKMDLEEEHKPVFFSHSFHFSSQALVTGDFLASVICLP